MSRTTQDITARISPGGRALFDDGKPHEPVGHQSVMTIAEEKKDLGSPQKSVTREVPARSGAFLLLAPATAEQR